MAWLTWVSQCVPRSEDLAVGQEHVPRIGQFDEVFEPSSEPVEPGLLRLRHAHVNGNEDPKDVRCDGVGGSGPQLLLRF